MVLLDIGKSIGVKMGIILYNVKTKNYDTCSAKNWSECREHPQNKGWVLFTPGSVANLNEEDLESHTEVNKNQILSIDEYYNNLHTSSVIDMSVDDLAKEVVGHSISAIQDNQITLSNGKILEIENTSDCCAWFEGDIKAFDFKDNIVTAVEQIDREPHAKAFEAWTLRVLSNHKTIAEIDIEGDSSSGYYCHSVNLTIKG